MKFHKVDMNIKNSIQTVKGNNKSRLLQVRLK